MTDISTIARSQITDGDPNWRFTDMNKLLKTIVLLVQIGGGLVGLGFIGRTFLTGQLTEIAMIIHVAFVLVFSFGIVAGVFLIKRPRLGRLLSAIFQAMQIPLVVGPTVSYALFSGACFNVYKHATGWGFNVLFGSRYYFFLNSGEPWSDTVVGINCVALVLFVLLLRESWLQTADAKFSEFQSRSVGSARHFAPMQTHTADGSPLRRTLS
jgi:hypothetical protein